MCDLQAAGGTAITLTEGAATTGSARRLRILAIAIAVAGILLDQGAKALALQYLEPGQPIPLFAGVNLLLIFNPGAAFGMGEEFTVVLTCVAIAALVGVSGWLLPKVRHLGWAVATGLLLAGIVGNLIDRLVRDPGPFRGHVVDFLQLPYFAIINIADIFITAAAVMVIWLSLITQVTMAGVSLKQTGDE